MRVVAAKAELCSGCKACQVLCSLTRFRENNPKKSALRILGHFPEPGVYEINICSQCGVCANECPVQAIQIIGAAYVIDTASCIGCGLCVQACPTGSMVRHASIAAPIKCVSCGACVEYCPRRALVLQEDQAG
ncbi:MAG: 4Fe-4S binding protein [Acidobacteria bacterium]|nr:4Fe-4S binding protein [Acidobacteriota bacterium]